MTIKKDFHPILGAIEDGETVASAFHQTSYGEKPVALPAAQEAPPQPPAAKFYCDECGGVGFHVPGCPQTNPATRLRAAAPVAPEALEEDAPTLDKAPSEDPPSLRKISKMLASEMLKWAAEKLSK